ncbi:sigma-70 family RNA polymerase sigma factor [Roseovarius sp. SCSIO 43702]|uniref:sigma-70 family RNA polymerase sigma factor n=1 Tax=Roseovarius sp. SCSIO 43702 TaxID=2823043 RepID=UPI001C73857C|nr:sigma-70 family RNA polymerase sigma factor [Roseovarius sp. SCSIO 43702]QYX58158.1 sigma-70 family RNA polymerase sigma factor [Roseovarius sp. SCSIO 43702]
MNERAEIEALLARAALGERAAFSELYARTSAKLFGVILRVLKDRAAAEDALQESYVKIWRNAARYRANGLSPMTWLITVARNTAIDRVRRGKTQPGGDVSVEDAALADPAPTPEAAALKSDEQAQLLTCFEELEPDRAQAVRRAYLEGESYADLATRFGVPINTMRTWLRRSLLKLRECLTR